MKMLSQKTGPKILLIALVVICFISRAERLSAAPHTPSVGSPERVAIANAVRGSVAKLGDEYAEDARRGEKFTIAILRVEGRFAFFEGGGHEVDGRMTYGPVEIVAFLEGSGSNWRVLNLQVRGDVPDASEVAEIRASLPPDYPLGILNEFWRNQLMGRR
jgi:hypothetical protein